MELINENIRSYVNDPRMIELLYYISFMTGDVCGAWIGSYEPATTLNDERLHSLIDMSRAHYMYYRWFIENWMKPDSVVLDIGSGSGHRLNMLSRYTRRVDGVEKSREQASFYQNYNSRFSLATTYIGDFLDGYSGLPGPYAAIFAIEIIEHIDPLLHANFAKACSSLLEPGGMMFLTTPRDVPIRRQPPHIGLWEDSDRDEFVIQSGLKVKYSGWFNAKKLRGGETNPETDSADSATAYAIVLSNG